MTDYEYEEENLDDFMINASSILSEDNNPDRNTIVESLKQHLSSIFHIQNEMENFFNTLNGVIFTSKSYSSKKAKRIDNRQPFILYPIVFSFNPRTTSYFIDHYLETLQQAISEDNRPDFTFLSEVFADVVLAFFTDEKNNKYLIKKSFLLDPGKKKTIYEKILTFCNKNIKTNKKLEQSVGCLLLTELIENCPLVKEDRNLDSLFKTISDYLDDRWFECKIDLLNCTISLIFSAEYKFKPYANICLFRVLDYLTDMDWMRRKLGINIVYTLVYYCKDEISTVKENVIEFLNTLKEDSIAEVREVCLHTLQILGEVEDDDENFDFEINNEINKPKNVYNKYRNKNIGRRNKLNRDNERPEKEVTSRNNRSINSVNRGKSQTKDRIKSRSPDNLMQKLKKEQDFLLKMEKDYNEKKKNFKANNYATITISTSNNNKSKISKNNYSGSNTIPNDTSKNKSKQNFKEKSKFDNNSYETITTSINSIFDQLKKIQEDQIEFRQMLTNLKQAAGNNYLNLNERLRALEKSSKYGRNNQYQTNFFKGGDYQETRSQSKERRRPNIIFNKSDEKIKIEELKELFNNGKYNEAILETYQNDRYLLKLLPLIDKKIIPKIEIALLEDAISRLNKRLTILCMEGDRESINDVLQFYIQLLKSKIDLKLVTQLSINDALNFLRSKGSSILIEEDHHNIEKIINSLRIEKD